MEEIMKISRLGVSFDGKQVLRDVSLNLYPGRITAILGPSGCGKTTFLRALNGFLWEEPGCKTEGEILLNGRNIKELSREELHRRVGLVFQTPSPFPFSIYRNMTFALQYYGERDKRKLRETAEEKLRMAGLYEEVKGELEKSAQKLSGGQKQRLCIARALTVEPELLLLDEPCSALDVKSSAIIENMLTERKTQYPVVIVTHNIAQARRIADDAAFFYEGRLVEAGSAKELFSNPKEEETRSFLEGAFG